MLSSADRTVGSLRRECLDHFIVLDEQRLRSALTEFVQYYNARRRRREPPGTHSLNCCGSGPVSASIRLDPSLVRVYR
jgi:hypothetical protein